MNVYFVFSDTKVWWKKLGCWLIKFIDKGSGSHFALGITNNEEIYYYESVLPKSRVISKEQFLAINEIKKQYLFAVPKELEKEVVRFLDSLVSRPYSIQQLILIFISKSLLPTNIFLKGAILNHEKSLICTEVGTRFIEQFMNYKLTKSHDNTGVKDIQIICEGLVLQDKEWKVQL